MDYYISPLLAKVFFLKESTSGRERKRAEATVSELCDMGTVCQKCGNIGYAEDLIYCEECKLYAEHSYCLDMLPTTDEDITWLCEECSQLFSTKPPPPSQRQSYCNVSSFEMNMSSEAAEDVVDGEQLVRKKRRLILEDSSDEKMESVPSDNDSKYEGATKISEDRIYVYSSPIFNPVWRGYFDINGRCYGRLAAHLSNKASSKVFEGANMLDGRLHLQKLPRNEAWPKSFSLFPPTDDNIALYFFPESQRDDVVIDELLDEVNHLDLVLTAELDHAELLLSSSRLLPKNYWRFRGKCYIWGVFRGKQLSNSNPTIMGEYPMSIANHGGSWGSISVAL